MKNPALDLEKNWSRAADRGAKNFWRKMAMLEKANRESTAKWLADMKASGALAANFAYDNPAAVLAAA